MSHQKDFDDLSALQMRAPGTEAEWDSYYDLRWRILREPWDQPRGSEKDDIEDQSEHLMLAGPQHEVLACGRFHLNSPSEAQVRFMAVHPDLRGRGVGGRLLQECERRAKAAGAKYVVLNAREDAQRFYAKHGYRVTGPAPTIFSAVKHVRMRKDL